MKTLDRYIIRQFLGTFFFILVLIMAIAVVFDASEKTKDFAKTTASFGEIIRDYYVNFVIYYANLFSGLLIFIAVILFTSRLSHRSEVIAILSSGVSFLRFLWPFFIAATFLTGIALMTNHYVLPKANRVRLAFEEVHMRAPFRVNTKHIHREIEPGVIAYCETFHVEQQMAYRFSLERWNDGGELEMKMLSDRAHYDSLSNRWTIYDARIRTFRNGVEHLSDRAEIDTVIALRPADMGRRQNSASAMDTDDLAAFIKAEKARGSDAVSFAQIDLYQRTSLPFATYIFTLIGVSIASRKVRGGTGVHLAAGVLLILIYIFGMKLTTVAATNAGMHPMLAVWTPNILFLLVGIYIYRTAPK